MLNIAYRKYRRHVSAGAHPMPMIGNVIQSCLPRSSNSAVLALQISNLYFKGDRHSLSTALQGGD